MNLDVPVKIIFSVFFFFFLKWTTIKLVGLLSSIYMNMLLGTIKYKTFFIMFTVVNMIFSFFQ